MTDHDKSLEPTECSYVTCPECEDMGDMYCDLCNGSGEVPELIAHQWNEVNKENNINL